LTRDQNTDLQHLTALWDARPRLSAPQWASLYGIVRGLCMQLGADDGRDDEGDRFAAFFRSRVVDVVPSELPSPNCVPLYFDWFQRLSEPCDVLASELKDLQRCEGASRMPSLVQLEDDLCRPSDALCVDIARRIVSGDATPATVGDEDLATRARQVADAMRRPAFPVSAAQGQLPPGLAAYLDRKAAAESHAFSTGPQAGQILRVDALAGPDGPLEEDLARPLFVLIDCPTDVDGVWWGWMVGAEPDYACEWDFVLEQGNEPIEPMAALVQLWNPVHLYLPTAARVVGQLAAEQMAALHALVADFLAGADGSEPADVSEAASEPRLVRRKTGSGRLVQTGRPLGDAADIRRLQQSLYESVAELVQRPARMAAARQAQASWLEGANVQQTGVNRFVATARHDASLQLEISFQFPGAGESVMLIQKRHGERHRAPLMVSGRRIDLDGGVAFPDAVVSADLAKALGLPDTFVHWSKLGAEFERAWGRTTARTRSALQELRRAVAEAALNPAHLFRFLFEPPGAVGAAFRSVAARDTGAAQVAVVVVRLERTGEQGGWAHLWWPGPPPAIERVEVLIGGKSVGSGSVAGSDAAGGAVEIVGVPIDEDAPARAEVIGGTLRIAIG
jgi:hypothetical protein